MNVLYISTFVNQETLGALSDQARKDISMSANKYSDLIRKGLEANKEVNLKCIFAPSIGDYSISGIWYYSPRKNSQSPKGCYLGCLNFTVFKQVSVSCKVFLYAFWWLLRSINRKEKVIILSSVQLPFLLGLLPLKMTGIKVALFVPDLPKYQYNYSDLKGVVKRSILPLYVVFTQFLYRIVTYFIFITKYMVEDFPKRPYTIMEGLVDAENSLIEIAKFPVFTVMYAGALHESMGIRTFLDAIELIPEKNIQFLFFGKGDMIDLIKKRRQKDERIVYGGVIPHEQVLILERQVHLLINPRTTTQEFTKYSFPSKLMEYMLSGTPVLTTRLACIPEEYFDKMYFIEEETPRGMMKAIISCVTKKQEELETQGIISRKYVLQQKNNVNQLDKIINDIKNRLF